MDLVKVSLDIPFPTSRTAEIAFDVLRIDAETKKGGVKKNLQIKGNILKM